MSIDPSLKIKDALRRHRNVLSRGERIEMLKEEERWEEGDSVFGLVKVAHRKSRAGKVKDEKPEAGVAAVAAEGVEATAATETQAKETKEK